MAAGHRPSKRVLSALIRRRTPTEIKYIYGISPGALLEWIRFYHSARKTPSFEGGEDVN